jgi:L-alanine-DL-glutamate epimerase-like enolase superfamily enzyme
MKQAQQSMKQNHSYSRRSLLQGLGGLSLAGTLAWPVEEQVAYATQGVSRSSQPSALRITDLRVAVITGVPFRVPLIRIDTNQGLSGYGEVRDGGSKEYALILKSRLLGENPCNVERLFKKIRQFGHHGRQGGGVSGVEMALWDLAGKAFGVPVYQMLGGRYRDRIRLYADTPSQRDPQVFAEKLKERVKAGFTFLKMDLGINMFRNAPGMLSQPANPDRGRYFNTQHPFTRIQLTDKGIAELAGYVAQVREGVGSEVPLGADHFGHIDVTSCIRLGKALEPFQMAWLEDMVPWQFTDLWKEITQALDVPTLTGEDIYCLDGFKPLIDQHAVDMVHPDLATAGGILETKKIGDYAQEKGIAMAMHFAGSPISFMANLHCAAATENFVALEHHGVDVSWWEDLATGIEKPLHRAGFAPVPQTPGLGVELNLDVVKQHLGRGEEAFAPTDEWNRSNSNDRLWS